MASFAMAMLVCSDLARSRTFYQRRHRSRAGRGPSAALGRVRARRRRDARPAPEKRNAGGAARFAAARASPSRTSTRSQPTARLAGVPVLQDPLRRIVRPHRGDRRSRRVCDSSLHAPSMSRMPQAARDKAVRAASCGRASTRRTTATTSSTIRRSPTPSTTRCCAS